MPLFFERVLKRRYQGPSAKPDEGVCEAKIGALISTLDLLERSIAGPFLLGEQITLVRGGGSAWAGRGGAGGGGTGGVEWGSCGGVRAPPKHAPSRAQADVTFAPYLYQLFGAAGCGDLLEARPRIAAWYEAIKARPAWAYVTGLKVMERVAGD